MSNYDSRYNTLGSVALKPRQAPMPRLTVVEGGAPRVSARRRSVAEQARRAYDWYVSAPDPVCAAPVMGDRERLSAYIIFLAIVAIVLVGAFI